MCRCCCCCGHLQTTPFRPVEYHGCEWCAHLARRQSGDVTAGRLSLLRCCCCCCMLPCRTVTSPLTWTSSGRRTATTLRSATSTPGCSLAPSGHSCGCWIRSGATLAASQVRKCRNEPSHLNPRKQQQQLTPFNPLAAGLAGFFKGWPWPAAKQQASHTNAVTRGMSSGHVSRKHVLSRPPATPSRRGQANSSIMHVFGSPGSNISLLDR